MNYFDTHPLWRKIRERTEERDEARQILDEALLYAQHDYGCVYYDPDGGEDCNCGLTALRARVDATRGLRPQAPDATASPDYEDA